MRLTEIGQQLRAYRLESGLRAEEVATQLGISRAALYRYEKGEVIKLDTVQRLAELLKIAPLSLLGVGVEYYSRPITYFERLRQIEEDAKQLVLLEGALFYLTTSDAYDAALADAFADAARRRGPARREAQAAGDTVLDALMARKRTYAQRLPEVTCLIAEPWLRRFLARGVGGGLACSEPLRRRNRQAAVSEALLAARLMEAEPTGLRFGLLPDAEPAAGFVILRSRDRASVAINPFLPDAAPIAPAGVAMLTAADEAVAAHQQVADARWREALKGESGAARLRQIAGEFS